MKYFYHKIWKYLSQLNQSHMKSFSVSEVFQMRSEDGNKILDTWNSNSLNAQSLGASQRNPASKNLEPQRKVIN